MLVTPKEVQQYLREKRWVAPDIELSIESLSGGVSNQVWKITGPGVRWVMKQALAKLRVEADWYSDVRRIERECTAMQALEPMLQEGEIPRVWFADEEAHTFVMTCAPDDAVTWKDQLMAGVFDAELARKAGSLLGRLHGESRVRADELRETFADQTFFDELRIDPFHRFLAGRYPDLAAPISALIGQLTTDPICLVHGDYSPKNMLVTTDKQLILLDFEVAHWGNPLFDLAFCLCHLMLKGWVLQREAEALELIRVFLEAYGRDTTGLLPHLGLMLLARVDGKSPMGYIKEEALKARIRQTGAAWIRSVAEEQQSAGETVLREICHALEGV